MAGNTAGTRAAVIVGGNRIPFARANGPYAEASNQDMLIAALDGLVARFGLSGEAVGEVAAGAVLKHSRDFNLTRESVLGCQLSSSTPAYDVQQAYGTGRARTASPPQGCAGRSYRVMNPAGVCRRHRLQLAAALTFSREFPCGATGAGVGLRGAAGGRVRGSSAWRRPYQLAERANAPWNGPFGRAELSGKRALKDVIP